MNFIIKLDEIWAKAAKAQDIAAPNPAKIGHGFDYGEKPSHSTFNWIMNKVTASANAFQSYGILPWNADIMYKKGAVVQDSNGIVHQAIQDSKGKILTEKSYWKIGIEQNGGYVKKAGNQDPTDPTGGDITGDIIIKPGARLIIEA